MNTFLKDRYEDIVKMSEKITQDPEYREIAHFIIEQFMMHERAQELVDEGNAMRFMSGMIHRNYHSSTSPYHKIFRQSGRVYAKDNLFRIQSQFDEDGMLDNDQLRYSSAKGNKTERQKVWDHLETEDYDFIQDLQLDTIEGILEDMMADEQHVWYMATLFRMWIETPNYSELERRTKIPRTSISQAVNECKQYIQNKMREYGHDI